MKRIEDIDKNFKINNTICEKDIVYYDIRENPFDVYGLYNYKTEPVFKRLPDDVAASVSEGVKELAIHTSGGRVRFKTNSEYVAIIAKSKHYGVMSHMTVVGQAGFDMYLYNEGKTQHIYTLMRAATTEECSDIMHFGNNETREFIINMPLYNGVEELYIGLQENAIVEGGSKYKYDKPVLYYGSSITQGGCASRPGNSYPGFISRKLDCDFINLGFSGSALGEDAIADYMRELDISIFVCDYDYNAPDAGHLEKTHERLYKRFREVKKDTPIIFISKPGFYKDDDKVRREIILRTYNNAVAGGDNNVYFIDGETLFDGEFWDECTVDKSHPNDIGFLRMAEKIGAVIGKILENN